MSSLVPKWTSSSFQSSHKLRLMFDDRPLSDVATNRQHKSTRTQVRQPIGCCVISVHRRARTRARGPEAAARPTHGDPETALLPHCSAAVPSTIQRTWTATKAPQEWHNVPHKTRQKAKRLVQEATDCRATDRATTKGAYAKCLVRLVVQRGLLRLGRLGHTTAACRVSRRWPQLVERTRADVIQGPSGSKTYPPVGGKVAKRRADSLKWVSAALPRFGTERPLVESLLFSIGRVQRF